MRILILGTAPGFNEVNYSEYDEIWGLQAHVGIVPLTRCYEIHHIDMLKAHTQDVPGYLAKPASLKEKFCVHPTLLEICPLAREYEFEPIISHYGRVFTNSVSWMIAHAILLEPELITIAGVNMQVDEEYGHQKPSCWYMIGWARANGIAVNTPSTNTLLNISYLYGYECPPIHRDIFERRKSHTEKLIAENTAKQNEAKKAIDYYTGCVDTLEFMMRSSGLK